MTFEAIQRIEKIVCACVNDTMSRMRPDYSKQVCTDNLYTGVTKAPTCVLVARQMCYMILHDTYGLSYTAISRHAGISKRRIMSGIDKARQSSFDDSLYRDTKTQILSLI